jgi:tRNA pseudouridine38-40 synthase
MISNNNKHSGGNMRNIKLTIEYDGNKYKGWQKLGDNNNTVQYKLENSLSSILGEEINIIASGRTDAGAHALNQIANFHCNNSLSPSKLIHKINSALPNDILVKSAQEVPLDFHSRYNATRKTYTYKIDNGLFPGVFNTKFSHHIKEPLDVDKMRKAASYLIGKRDFQSFTALKSGKKSTVKELYSIEIEEKNNLIEISYTGNSFLYKMVRILTGTLIEVGLNKIKPEDLIKIINAKDRQEAGPLVPAQGLHLISVEY